MKPATFDRWFLTTVGLEGSVPWMYLDILGLVTTGIGNLIDPVESALALPWTIGGNANVPAAKHEINAAWHTVKAAQSMKLLGGANKRWADLTDLRLTQEGIEHVVRMKQLANESVLRHRWPDYDDWPEAAQIAVNSWAWACGPAGAWPKFDAALKARDWATAAKEGHIEDSKNPGVRPRNAWQVALFAEAAEQDAQPMVTSEIFPVPPPDDLPG